MADETGGRWVDLGEAGRRLGLAPDALRKRIRRGSCPWPARRDNAGRWQVMVPDAAADVRADTGGRREDSALIAELATLRERVAQQDRIIAMLEAELARRRWPGLWPALRRFWSGEG